MPIWEYVNRRHGQRPSNSIRGRIESKSWTTSMATANSCVRSCRMVGG